MRRIACLAEWKFPDGGFNEQTSGSQAGYPGRATGFGSMPPAVYMSRRPVWEGRSRIGNVLDMRSNPSEMGKEVRLMVDRASPKLFLAYFPARNLQRAQAPDKRIAVVSGICVRKGGFGQKGFCPDGKRGVRVETQEPARGRTIAPRTEGYMARPDKRIVCDSGAESCGWRNLPDRERSSPRGGGEVRADGARGASDSSGGNDGGGGSGRGPRRRDRSIPLKDLRGVDFEESR